jgi:hypothetical protein
MCSSAPESSVINILLLCERVCACVRKRERARVRACVRKRERARVCACARTCVRESEPHKDLESDKILAHAVIHHSFREARRQAKVPVFRVFSEFLAF